MLFNSLAFLTFFAFVLGVHRLPLSWRTRKFNLIWLSYAFYAAWNPPFVVLLWISTVVDWYVGKWLHRAKSKRGRRWLLMISLTVNLGMLAFFKYGGFILDNFAILVQFTGLEWQPARSSIVLPIGISFYTFQTLSYTLDIFYRRMKPWNSFLDFALFVTFFPQLVAGPIVRAREFLPQCKKPQIVTSAQFSWGLYLLVLGLFLKVVISDGLLASDVERVYDGSLIPSTRDMWVGTTAFAGQVYCDFSGYSLCAIGVAKCIGFQLPTNFRFPLAASGFQAFWSRWHISLTTWLRDYVYRPIRALGSGRGTLFRLAINTMITWGLIGLWHGAAWGFVLWGLMTGSLLILERVVRSYAPPSPIWTTMLAQFAFAVIQFGGHLCCAPMFRAPTSERLWALLDSMFLGGPDDTPNILNARNSIFLIATVLALFLSNWLMRDSSLEEVANRTSWPLRTLALSAMLVAIFIFHGGDRAFIYFQF